MSKFLISEKPSQTTFKATASCFSDTARAEGVYKHHPYPFCLPAEHADQNLIPAIRDPIRAYFTLFAPVS